MTMKVIYITSNVFDFIEHVRLSAHNDSLTNLNGLKIQSRLMGNYGLQNFAENWKITEFFHNIIYTIFSIIKE